MQRHVPLPPRLGEATTAEVCIGQGTLHGGGAEWVGKDRDCTPAGAIAPAVPPLRGPDRRWCGAEDDSQEGEAVR